MKQQVTGRGEQERIYRAGALGHRPKIPTRPERLAAAARRKLSRRAWAYVAHGAGGQATAVANRAALDRWRLVPRHLHGGATRDTEVELFRRRYPSPLLVAPIGVLELAHREADRAVAAAAAAVGVPMIVSTQASVPMEETVAALGGAPWWYQLYWSRDEALMASFVRRAERAGTAAIVLTLDTNLLGWRTEDLDLGSLPFVRGEGIAQYTSDPVFARLVEQRAAQPREALGAWPTPKALATVLTSARRYPGGLLDNLTSPMPRAAVETFLDVYSDPAATWTQVDKLRALTQLPILVKGVLDPRDAALALQHGVDGIVVSNHGGRQVDGAVGALDALPGVVAEIDGRVPVLFDSGIRGGADMVKALALGARAVLVGRPYVFGLALAGQAGVEAVLRHLLAELDLTLALCGRPRLDDLGPDLLRPAGLPERALG